MLIKNILYAIKLLAEKNIKFGKTFIQKVLYLSLPEDERDLYYIPYYYGPYSENVQMLLKSLVFIDYIDYNEIDHSFQLKKTDDSLIKYENERIKFLIDFLIKNDIKNTSKISNLAKTFMILDANNSLKNGHRIDELIKLIKERADFVGWKELSKYDNDLISGYIKLSKKLAKNLPN